MEKGWSTIEEAFQKLLKVLEDSPGTKPKFVAGDSEKLYTTVRDLCSKDYTKRVYDNYCNMIEIYTKETVLPSLSNKHGEHMLEDFAARWFNHKAIAGEFCRFFAFVDAYLPNRKNVKDVTLTLFRDLVYSEMHPKARAAVLALILKEREGEQINRAQLKTVLEMFIEINGMGQMEKYEEDFESHMLKDTATYYSSKASTWIQEETCAMYMLKSETCLKEERDRAASYLPKSTEPKLVEIVEKELLVVNAKQLFENEHSGCRALLNGDKISDLSRMFRLYRKIPQKLKLVVDVFMQHVTAEGIALIKEAEDAGTNQGHIRKVIELHDRRMDYVTDCFQDHPLFQKAMKEAFGNFCLKRVGGISSEELLATFCDNILKKEGGTEKLEDDALENTFEKVVKLVAYVKDRESFDRQSFADFYMKKQAHRLLFDTSINEENERSILSKLEKEFNPDFTSKMEKMVEETTRARQFQNLFTEEQIRDAPLPGIDFTLSLLPSTSFPTSTTPNLKLPNEMVECVARFRSFRRKYIPKETKLSVDHSLGTCLITGNFKEKKIELVVSTYQAAVLSLFNEREVMTYKEILEEVGMSRELLSSQLSSLACGKYQILIKTPDSRTISETDSFEYNALFTDEKDQITVPSLPTNHRKKVVEKVVDDYVGKINNEDLIKSSIMQIMKAKKKRKHELLVADTIESVQKKLKVDEKVDTKMVKKVIEKLIDVQVDEKVDTKMVKKVIEKLIDTYYLKRDSEDPTTYNYLA